jgi:hypothetical protein
MGVLSTKIDNLEWLFAIKSRSFTSSFKLDFKIDTVVDDDMKSITVLCDIVGVTDNFDFTFIVRLKNPMSLNNFPDALFLFGECCVLSWNLGFIRDLKLLCNILEYFNILVVKNFLISFDVWSS